MISLLEGYTKKSQTELSTSQETKQCKLETLNLETSYFSLSSTSSPAQPNNQPQRRRQREIGCFKVESDVENRVGDILVYPY